MGWTIKRVDGSYRVWNRNAQDDTLRPGEVWEELPTMPEITSGVKAADGITFMRGVHLNLAGADPVAKLARGMTMRKLSPFIRDFIHNTAHTPLSSHRQAAAKTIWGWIKDDPVIGLTGADLVNRLTSAEAATIEADAAVTRVRLA